MTRRFRATIEIDVETDPDDRGVLQAIIDEEKRMIEFHEELLSGNG